MNQRGFLVHPFDVKQRTRMKEIVEAFEEAKELIEKAKERKGYK